MPSSPQRFLGFGFAVADLLIELRPDGRVAFALGAGEAVLGMSDTKLAGATWRDIIHADDQPMVEALLAGLTGGTRAGPVVVGIQTPDGVAARSATLTAIRLPQNKGAISCTFSRAVNRAPGGVQDRETFEARAAELLAGADEDLELAFVQLAGLTGAQARKKDPAQLKSLIAGVLRAQSYRGEAPTEVGPNRYALVRGRDQPLDAMTARIGLALAQSGLDGVSAQTAAVPMSGVERPRQITQALRYALNEVVENGLQKGVPADFSESLDRAMRATMSKAGQLGAAIKHKRFQLHFQPVVGLANEKLHHHEVLVRFGADGSPFPTIRLAEELDLIESLDQAILDETLACLKKNPDLILAVNMSGRSLMSDAYVDHAVKRLRETPSVKGRLMFELTESAAVEDLPSADRRIQALRALGSEVCLDDFGAGAASLAYLQQLTLDLLKIDGRYIRDLQHGGREATFVKHLVNMCAELKVRTLAEMVETREAEDAVRGAGVDYAQGWLYGRATEKPMTAAQFATFQSGGVAREGILSLRAAQAKRSQEWG